MPSLCQLFKFKERMSPDVEQKLSAALWAAPFFLRRSTFGDQVADAPLIVTYVRGCFSGDVLSHARAAIPIKGTVLIHCKPAGPCSVTQWRASVLDLQGLSFV